MTPESLIWMLTALAAVVVLLTRARLLATERQSGVSQVPRRFLDAHTALGWAALALWVAYLVAGHRVVGGLALVMLWALAVIGLAILARWLPSAGAHSEPATDDTWASGPWLSILAHVGMVGGIVVFTWAYSTGTV